MKPEASKSAFKKFLRSNGSDPEALSPKAALDLMIEFYETVPAEGCDRSADGDMLLFECGVYDRGFGPEFSLGFVRQFMKPDTVEEAGDDAMSQLQLRLFFDPELKGARKAEFNVWCADEGGLAEFRKAVTGSKGFRLFSRTRGARVEITLDGA